MRKSQQGSVSALVVCSISGLMSLAGLVYDGGRVISEYVDLSDLAENAGRVGSQQITGIRSENPHIDRVQANSSIDEFLNHYNLNAEVEVLNGGVRVTLKKRVQLTLLSLFGLKYRDIRVSRSVAVVEG